MGGKHTWKQYDFLPKSGQISKGGAEQAEMERGKNDLFRVRRAEGIKRPKAVQNPNILKKLQHLSKLAIYCQKTYSAPFHAK